jgi:hypothetical protein
MDKISVVIKSKYTEIDSIKKEEQHQRDQKSDVRERLDALQAEIDKIKETTQELYDKKYETKEEFYKAKYEFDIEKAQIA